MGDPYVSPPKKTVAEIHERLREIAREEAARNPAHPHTVIVVRNPGVLCTLRDIMYQAGVKKLNMFPSGNRINGECWYRTEYAVEALADAMSRLAARDQKVM